MVTMNLVLLLPEVIIPFFRLTIHPGESSIAKMKDILVSQFNIEIEYKTQKIQEVVEAIQKVESMRYELQALWSQLTMHEENEGMFCSITILMCKKKKMKKTQPNLQEAGKKNENVKVWRLEIYLYENLTDNLYN